MEMVAMETVEGISFHAVSYIS